MSDRASQEESQRIHEFTSHHLAPVNVVQATCELHSVFQNDPEQSTCYIESLAVHPDAIPSAFEYDDETLSGLPTVPKYSEAEIAALQRADPSIGVVIQLCETGQPAPTTVNCPELQIMLKEKGCLEMKDSLLFRKRQCDNKTVYQFVLPQTLRNPVLHSLHDEMGHLGVERTVDQISLLLAKDGSRH